MIKPIYLCGPIQGRTWVESHQWRDYATTLLAPAQPVRNPLTRGYDEHNWQEIVEGDIADIAECRALLVMYDKPSVGTAMEIRLAKAEYGIPVHVVDISGAPRSPWLIYHAERFYDTLEEACAVLREDVG